MSTTFDKELTPEPAQRIMGSLGTLILINRKTGEDVQSFPIDGDRVSIGRDWDCHVRLYFPDVSKRHAEIVFDLLTNQATLAVLGNNGIQHGSSRSRLAKHSPPSVISLTDKDIFTIRNKYFRFEYGTCETLDDKTLSPEIPAHSFARESSQQAQSRKTSPRKARKSMIEAALAEPLRRRQSHRLSLVPVGRTFEPMSPMKNRRQSTLGLVKPSSTPQHTRGITEEEEETPDNDDDEEQVEVDVVDVVQGEDGDVVYMEVQTPAKAQPIYERAFMTPQQAKRAEPRNTSAVPRTRKMAPLPQRAQEQMPVEFVAHVESSDLDQHEDEEAFLNEPEQPVAPPKTPRSVPLPDSADTPYAAAMQTPAPLRVPQTVALSTPKGPVTLRKALLVHSARKAWENSRTPGVDGAIEQGSVEMRKSRKSGTPVRAVQQEEVSAEEWVEQEEEEQLEEPQNAQAEEDEEEETREVRYVEEVQEELDEGISGSSSLEADMSLDVIQPNEEHAALEEDEELDQPETKNAMDEAQAQEVEEEEEQEEEETKPLVVTTPAHRAIHAFATTPGVGTPSSRRSLGSLSGRPVRFQRLPATPHAVSGVYIQPAAPGTLGPPQRRVQPKTDSAMMATPARPRAERFEPDARLDAELKRRRDVVATPRQLPAAPIGGFKDFVREPAKQSPLKLLHRTPAKTRARHDAVSPEVDEAHAGRAGPRTPMDNIRAQLAKMRRDSEVRQAHAGGLNGRRATVGFALPATPAQMHEAAVSASYTVVNNDTRRTFTLAQPSTPLMEAHEGGDVSSFGGSPLASSSEAAQQTAPLAATPRSKAVPQSGKAVKPALATPSYAGVRDMLVTPKAPPKTPYMRDLARMYPAPSAPVSAATPSFRGMKDMMRLPKSAATPNFKGVKNLFVQPRVARTPGMEGVQEMYAPPEPEVGQEEVEGVEGSEEGLGAAVLERGVVEEDRMEERMTSDGTEDETVVAASHVDEGMSAPQVPEAAVQAEAAVGSQKRAARGKTVKAAPVAKAATVANKSAPSRTRKPPTATAATEAPTASTRSAPTRAKRTPNVEPESVAVSTKVSKPTRSTRAATRDPTVEPSTEEEVASAIPEKAVVAVKTTSKPSTSRSIRRPAAPAAGSEPSTAGRARTTSALTESGGQDQPAMVANVDGPADDTKPAVRGRRAVPAKKAPAAAAEEAVAVSPVKRSRGGKTKASAAVPTAAGEKENVPTELETGAEAKPEVVKKAPVKRGRKAGPEEQAEVVVPLAVAGATRATRSRR